MTCLLNQQSRRWIILQNKNFPTFQNLGSGLETRGTLESPDRLESVATLLQRPECDRGRRSFAKEDHGHVSRTISTAEPENGASARHRSRGTSSISSSCAERMFESQRWWASQRQSNGGILEVHPPKIKWQPCCGRCLTQAR